MSPTPPPPPLSPPHSPMSETIPCSGPLSLENFSNMSPGNVSISKEIIAIRTNTHNNIKNIRNHPEIDICYYKYGVKRCQFLHLYKLELFKFFKEIKELLEHHYGISDDTDYVVEGLLQPLLDECNAIFDNMHGDHEKTC